MNAQGIEVPAVILSGNLGKASSCRSINEAALALTKSLGRRGITVYRFHPDRMLTDLSSRYCIHVPCPNLYEDPMGLLNALIEFAERGTVRPVLYPSSDGSAQFIANNESVLRKYYALTSPPADCIGRTQNKRRLIEAARNVGIPVPQTYFPSDLEQLPSIAEAISFPAIIKPIYSPDWKRHAITDVIGHVKALKVSGPDQLSAYCRTLLSLSSEFMVQEIVSGSDENLITFIGYISTNGNLLTGCVRRKLRQYPPGFGYCCSTESVDDPEVFSLAAKLLKALNYSGIGCVEFKLDPISGKAKLIEINTRAVRTSALAIRAGSDFPWVAYLDCVSPGCVKPALDYSVDVLWIHMRDEIKAAGLLIITGQLSPVKWIRRFFGRKLVVAEFSWDDIKPGLLFWSHVPVSKTKRLLGRIRDYFTGKARPGAKEWK